ncbi:MAG: hypothetical protein ACOX6G_00530 [Christensenellales bacterium]|jgi:predicted deacylase
MKRIICLLIFICIILPNACANEQRVLFGDTFTFENNRVLDGAEDIAIEDVQLSWAKLPTSAQKAARYSTIGENTEQPTDIYIIDEAEKGPIIWIVGGTHGDERAGIFAATALLNLETSKGTIYIVPCLNTWGFENMQRRTKKGNDINRAYSHLDSPKDSSLLAQGLWDAIVQTKPLLVIDLHEAAYSKEGQDFLGKTIIYTEVHGIEPLFFSLLEATETDKLPFQLTGPGVKGSLNQELSTIEGIPVFTVETFRGYPLSNRVKDQLAFVRFVLEFYEMIEFFDNKTFL